MNKGTTIFVFQIFIVGILCSCQKKDDTNPLAKEEGAIMSLFIDKMAIAYPIPPPPPMDSLEIVIQHTNWDSIRSIKTDVIVDTVMFAINWKRKTKLPKQYDDFQFLVDSINKLSKKTIKQNYIKSEEGHHLIFGNSLDDFKGKYSQMVGISRIAFNNEKNMAAVYAGYSTHPLAAYLNLYLLRKTNGEWEIVFKKRISVS